MEQQWNSKSCSACPNLTSCRTQIVIASPCAEHGLLAIGEAPGADEDRIGEGFIGVAGKTLDRLFEAHGISRGDYGRANVCRCRPPENRKPSTAEINSCIPFLANLIQTVKPKVILAVGGTPTSVLCGKGTLYSQLVKRQTLNDWSARVGAAEAHKGLVQVLMDVPFVVPMPHSSPLAFNRNAPSGEKWARVAERQIALAVNLLRA